MFEKMKIIGFLFLLFFWLIMTWPVAYSYKLIKGQWPDWYNFVP